LLLFSALVLAAPAAGLASCGAENCPLDHAIRWSQDPFAYEVSYQYLDQDQPRNGTQDVAVGEVPRHHDEVRTLSRVVTARGSYRFAGAWSVGAALPFVDRYHEHNHNHGGQILVEQWHYSGVGDLEVVGLRSFGSAESRSRFFVSAGVKAPTGVTDSPNEDGDSPEPAALIGSGSWDVLAGAGAEWQLGGSADGSTGRVIPVRLSVTGRYNGTGVEEYRIGSQMQAHLGSEFPIGSSLALLGQANFRLRAKDDTGTSGEDDEDTGGTWLFLSPGLRVATGPFASLYGLVQIPVYQRVNGVQLVSEGNLYVGVTGGFY
jgi:hypothetical protein